MSAAQYTISALVFRLFVVSSLVIAWANDAVAERRALLIGCSEYQTNSSWDLPGAANDTSNFEHLLTKDFQFESVRKLVGWPDTPQERPTYTNICQAFEQEIRVCQPGDQLFILMSGHGSQTPVPDEQDDWLSPDNPEPDGYDEFFAAADYGDGKNFILDNQVGQWLDQLREKGVHTWIVFDSCFSGTMMRGHTSDTARGLPPIDVATPSAAERSPLEAKQLREASAKTHDGFLNTKQASAQEGSVVAFYAAQDFETAAEVVRPLGADESDDTNKHGLLSYHLEQCLRAGQSGLTYGDIGRSLISRYRAEGRRRPTPYFEGDVDREVFGLQRWPDSQVLYLHWVNERLQTGGGKLAGLRVGSVVEAFAPDDKELKVPLGELEVVESSATTAYLEPAGEWDDFKSLPENSRCRLVAPNFTDTKIVLGVADQEAVSDDSAKSTNLQALKDLAKEPSSCFEITETLAQSDWILYLTNSPIENSYTQSERPAAWLIPAEYLPAITRAEGKQHLSEELGDAPHVKYSIQQLSDPQAFSRSVQGEMQKIYVWQNLWALASSYDKPSGTKSKIAISPASRAGSIRAVNNQTSSAQLSPGDTVQLRISNSSYRSHWYVVFYLSSRYQIEHITTDAIKGMQGNTPATEALRRFHVNEDSFGCNGFVVIAVKQSEQREEPDYGFLSQPVLGAPISRSIPERSSGETAFDRTLRECFGATETRAVGAFSPEEPQMALWSWVTNAN